MDTNLQAAWHAMAPDAVLSALRSSPKGLSGAEAAKRLASAGPNRLRASKGLSPWVLLLRQCKNILILILLLGAVLSAFLGHETEAIAIAVIVAFAVVLGFLQEFRAEKAMEALRVMTAPAATVRRGGAEREIPATELVPGDIIVLAAGGRIPADGRLLESANLECEAAALTGESLPAEKNASTMDGKTLTPADRRNMVYAGTSVSRGRGTAVVTATAMSTEFGKIATLLEDVRTEQTPLQKNLDAVGKTLAKASLAIVAVIGALGWIRGEPLLDVVIFAIALAVAVVPEALPAVVTISLAIGMQRMVRRHALVRRLPAVEALGSTSVICTDKTGTLTKDEMTVRKIWVAGALIDVSGNGYEPMGSFSRAGKQEQPGMALLELLRGGILSSDAVLRKTPEGYDVQGDPTEGGIVVAAAKAGLRKEELDQVMPRKDEIPFSSETKRMTTLHESEGRIIAYAKGAPEVIVASCTRQWGEEGELPLNAAGRDAILQTARAMAGDALRVIAVARKGRVTARDAESGMKFLGLIGMIDPPRPEAKAAIDKCKAAGIRVVMITGDHPVTAEAIARELGLLGNKKVVTGAELEAMSDAALASEIDRIAVYARVSPSHKLRVVETLQRKGRIVAMTGDGVNDAPALKKADIGIAMGITGTDVTKEAAAMTLTDDNFASIVAAVEEGRTIYGNIKKYLSYLLSSNIGEICIMTGATLLGWPLPLTAVQILVVNLATDGLPALALAVDPPEPDLMSRPPRYPRTGIFTRPLLSLMLLGGLWSTAVNLGIFHWAMLSGRSLAEAMTMTFFCLILIEFFKAYAFRSDHLSVLRQPFTNRWLNLIIGIQLAALILIIQLPFLHQALSIVSLSTTDWLIICVAAFTILPALEIGKWMVRRGWFGAVPG